MVDTKKKELVGDFKNGGRELRRKGRPGRVRVHDFIIAGKGRAVPYGVYDIAANEGWVSVGVDHDAAAFAVASIRHWWRRMGRKRYPGAKRLLITAMLFQVTQQNALILPFDSLVLSQDCHRPSMSKRPIEACIRPTTTGPLHSVRLKATEMRSAVP